MTSALEELTTNELLKLLEGYLQELQKALESQLNKE